MAAEKYIHDLSGYLTAGNLSDLTLRFGGKTWQIHKALACCHSKWFQKAITSGFKETDSEEITLNDEPEFADAVDCMVSYFYKAAYSASEYDACESLLHVQVTIIADKYDCASLFELAKTSFANSVQKVNCDDWISIADLVYQYTTSELIAHLELRKIVITAVARRPAALSMILGKQSMLELLRSNADLATDLLLARPTIEDVFQHIFTCDHCQYVLRGSRSCPHVKSENGPGINTSCPYCGDQSGATSRNHAHTFGLFQALSSTSCEGIYTSSNPADSSRPDTPRSLTPAGD